MRRPCQPDESGVSSCDRSGDEERSRTGNPLSGSVSTRVSGRVHDSRDRSPAAPQISCASALPAAALGSGAGGARGVRGDPASYRGRRSTSGGAGFRESRGDFSRESISATLARASFSFDRRACAPPLVAGEARRRGIRFSARLRARGVTTLGDSTCPFRPMSSAR